MNRTMTSSPLNTTIDDWTAQAVVASRFLTGLYRALGDDRQVANATQAGAHAEEQAIRLSLRSRISAMRTLFDDQDPAELSRESRAWQILIEAQAGLSAFHCLVDGHERGSSIRGSRTATEKAFLRSLRGYRVAFPEEMTTVGIQRAIEIAAARCASSFTLEVDGASEQEQVDLRNQLHATILDTLIEAAIPAQA